MGDKERIIIQSAVSELQGYINIMELSYGAGGKVVKNFTKFDRIIDELKAQINIIQAVLNQY